MPIDWRRTAMNEPDARRLLRVALVLYVPMVACIAFVQPPGILRVTAPLPLAWGVGAAVLLGAGVVLGSHWAARHTQWGRNLHAEFHALLGGLDSPRILALSLLSAFGEEVLFRGVLQPRIGVLLATVLFAALHFPLRRSLWPWTIFAFVLGLVLGGLTLATTSLWPAIVLHFLINYFNLHDLAEAPPPGVRPGSGGL